MSNTIESTVIENITVPADITGDVVADVIAYAKTEGALESYRASVAASVKNAIEASKVPAKQAVEDLRAQLVAGGLAKQRASEILRKLGFAARKSSKKTTGKNADKKAALQPLVEELVQLASTKGGADAVSVLRRAYMTLLNKGAASA
jgi:hypothetical protein